MADQHRTNAIEAVYIAAARQQKQHQFWATIQRMLTNIMKGNRS